MRTLYWTQLVVGVGLAGSLSGCSAPPDLTGYPVNTPDAYSENKVFFAERLGPEGQHTQKAIDLEHLYEIRTGESDRRADDVIRHNDPISVVLQGIRLPEDAYAGTRDIAVVLDIHTSIDRGITRLVAFYQRDVPAGQMLNFNNLLVYADPQWDEANPPYFRTRVLDVKAERNRRTEAILGKVSNLSAEIGGMVPHPAIPIVTTAIDAASLVLSNGRNRVLLDFQVQFYGSRQRDNAGGATLGPLVAGQWLVLGRARNEDSTFWETDLLLDRVTDRIVAPTPDPVTRTKNVPVPYVSVALIRADAQVPKLVLDRSETLLSLLSSPTGKSDIDAVSEAADNLRSAVNAFTVERRLRKYRSTHDLQEIVDQLADESLNTGEQRRLMYVLNRVTAGRANHNTTPSMMVKWWSSLDHDTWELVEDDSAPMGVIYRPRNGDEGRDGDAVP
jgi:hypothetical protein